jgi:hypothetical protein
MLVHEAIEQAVAEEFVRLQASTFQSILNSSQSQAQAISAAIDQISQQGYEAWAGAAETAARFLYGKLRVNPNRSLPSLLAEPDTQAALRRPFERACDETRQAIGAAWQEGAAQGLAAANQDLGIAGFDPVGPVPLDQGCLAQLLDDAGANCDAATDRFMAAIQTNDPEVVREAVRSVGRNQALRARAGGDVAGKFSASKMKEVALIEAAEAQGFKGYKVWVTSFSPTTCGFCAALHGQRRKLGQPFSSEVVWCLPMGHPPRHPNCRCRVVLHLSSFANEEGPTPASMQQMAQEWPNG